MRWPSRRSGMLLIRGRQRVARVCFTTRHCTTFRTIIVPLGGNAARRSRGSSRHHCAPIVGCGPMQIPGPRRTGQSAVPRRTVRDRRDSATAREAGAHDFPRRRARLRIRLPLDTARTSGSVKNAPQRRAPSRIRAGQSRELDPDNNTGAVEYSVQNGVSGPTGSGVFAGEVVSITRCD